VVGVDTLVEVEVDTLVEVEVDTLVVEGNYLAFDLIVHSQNYFERLS
jgi:hypothetical protein